MEADAFGELPKDTKERLEQKIRMEWNYHSNVIEGNSLDYGETRSLLLWGITAKGKPLKDHLDLEGHNEAIKKLEAIAGQEIPITESLIKEFHRLILAEPFDDYRKEIQPGKYKETDNYLYNYRGERVDFCLPDEVPKKLNELINWTNNTIEPPKRSKRKYDVHPLLIAARFHYEFINIHPFHDGNGRLARIFMNLILMQCGYPPIIVNKDLKDQYYRAIEDSRERGMEVLAEFLGEQLIKSQELYLKAARGESIEEPDDLDKKIALLAKKMEGDGDNIKFKKSVETLKKTYDSFFKKFIEAIETKFSKFNTLFLNGFTEVKINEENLPSNNRHPIGLIQSSNIFWEAIESDKIKFITIRKAWYEFKKASNPFDVEISFYFSFHRYDFGIYTVIGEYASTDELLPPLNTAIAMPKIFKISEVFKSYYKDDYSVSEIEKIVTDVANDFFRYIEKKIEENKQS